MPPDDAASVIVLHPIEMRWTCRVSRQIRTQELERAISEVVGPQKTAKSSSLPVGEGDPLIDQEALLAGVDDDPRLLRELKRLAANSVKRKS